MKAFVTGAYGNIGKVLTKHLVGKGYTVYAASRQERESENENIIPVVVDIKRPLDYEKYLSECEALINLAVFQDFSCKDYKSFYATNVEASLLLFKNAAKMGVESIVNVSTQLVFETTGRSEANENHTLNIRPKDNYSRSKVESLIETRKLVQNSLPITTVFPTTVINLDDFKQAMPKNASFIQKVMWTVLGGGVPGGLINLFGSSKRILNYIDVSDLAEGIILAIEKGGVGEYILGGENITAGDYLKKAFALRGTKPSIFRFPALPAKIVASILKDKTPPSLLAISETVKGNRAFSSEKAKREIGFSPKKLL